MLARRRGGGVVTSRSVYFEEYVPGTVREFTGRTITADDIGIHAEQTGDFFPHHMDAEWCATQPFGRRMAHGTLVLSVAVGMTADEINPESMTYGYDRIRFTRPVFIDDTISVRAEIASKVEHRTSPELHGLVHEEVQVMNQHGDLVMALVHVYLVNRKQDRILKEEER
jgi:acyl dehydratase